MSAIKTVTLDPNVWCRNLHSGETTSLLFFVGDKRQQCCIGVACTALGMPDAVIRGKEYAHSLLEPRLPRAIRRLFEMGKGLSTPAIYSINDRLGESDAERVKLLNANLRENKVPLRFRLKKKRAATKARDAKRAIASSASEA